MGTVETEARIAIGVAQRGRCWCCRGSALDRPHTVFRTALRGAGLSTSRLQPRVAASHVLLEGITGLVPRPLAVSGSITGPVLFRVIERDEPTLLRDETVKDCGASSTVLNGALMRTRCGRLAMTTNHGVSARSAPR